MGLRAIHDFELDLLDCCLAIAERGIRVDETRRQQMLADLAEWREPLAEQAQAIVVPLLEAASVLPRKALFHEWWTCPCCRNGKLKREACWSCAGFEEKPTKKLLKQRAEDAILCDGFGNVTKVTVAEVVSLMLGTCDVCNGDGQRTTWVFNPGSHDQLKVVLYDVLKLPKRTKDKRLRSDEMALKELRAFDTTGLVAVLLQIAKATTLSEILLRIAPHLYKCPARDFAGDCTCGSDGRIRTFANPAGTETSRFSFSGGAPDHPTRFALVPSTNLGNMPKRVAKEDARFDVRACFVPSEGCGFVEADLSGAEAWIVAALCNDHDLLTRLRAGMKIHAWTAAHIFGGKPEDYPSDSFGYFVGKETRHSGNYGRGPRTLMQRVNFYSDQTGFSLKLTEAKHADATYRALHPTLRDWWERCGRQLRDSAQLTSIFGFRRTFFGQGRYQEMSETHREFIAHEPQHTVAHLLNRGLLRWWRQHDGTAGKLLLQVYDSVLIETPIARMALAARLLKRCLEEEITVNGIALTIPVDVSCSTANWASMEAA